jgi:riboflavin biosynthesis pyrimidine reductase
MARTKSESTRPYVICHMGPSVDGRIVTTSWGIVRGLFGEYERTAQTFDADAWMIGRISMEPYAGKARVPRVLRRKRAPRIPRTDFIARQNAASYAIAIDPSGTLRWTSNAIDGDHVITILTERVSNDYLAFLQSTGVSYLFGGRARIDLVKVLAKLTGRFGIRRLLLEGGGAINGSFLSANLIDELSLLVAPIADGGTGTPTLFDARPGTGVSRHLRLIAVERLEGDVVWLRYAVVNAGR